MNAPSSRWRLRAVPDWVTDAVLVAVMAVAISITIAVATEPGSRRPDALAYGLGLATAALLFFRRRWPIGVLLGSAAIMQLYFQLNYPGFFAAVPLCAALYNAAVTGHLRWTLLVAAFYIASPIIFLGACRTRHDPVRSQ